MNLEKNYDSIYNKFSGILLAKGITKKSFRLNNYINFDEIMDDNSNLIEVFTITKKFIDAGFYSFFNNNFESPINKLVDKLNKIYNYDNEDLLLINEFYYINDYDVYKLNEIVFFELEYGDIYMKFIEFDSNLEDECEEKIITYFYEYFVKNLPEDLRKPYTSLTDDEITLIKICNL